MKLPDTVRRTFSAKKAIEYDLPLPCVCQNTPSSPKIGMRPLDDLQRARFRFCKVCWRSRLRRHWGKPLRLIGARSALQRQLDHAMLQPLVRRELALQLFLPPHRCHRLVHPQHLMVARHHLARRPGLAGVEQDEVLDDVQQPLLAPACR